MQAVDPDAVLGEGTIAAKVMIVGLKPEVAEKRPFTAGVGEVVRSNLEASQVPAELVNLTYLIKSLCVRDLEAAVAKWYPLLRREIEVVKPSAVILLGEKLAEVVLGERRPIEVFRKTRFHYESLPDISFFVTFAPEQVSSAGGLESEIGNYFHFDQMAVFQTIRKYFSHDKTVRR